MGSSFKGHAFWMYWLNKVKNLLLCRKHERQKASGQTMKNRDLTSFSTSNSSSAIQPIKNMTYSNLHFIIWRKNVKFVALNKNETVVRAKKPHPHAIASFQKLWKENNEYFQAKTYSVAKFVHFRNVLEEKGTYMVHTDLIICFVDLRIDFGSWIWNGNLSHSHFWSPPIADIKKIWSVRILNSWWYMIVHI